MKVICDRTALLDAVNLVASVTPTRSPQLQLSCLKLTASKLPDGSGQLTLAGSDAETSLHLVVDRVDVAEPGAAVADAAKLKQIIAAEDGDATLTLETSGDQQLLIKGQDARFSVFTLPPTDYPPLPDLAKAVAGTGPEAARAVFTHDAGTLLDAITRTSFATARETSRYAINGVLLKRADKHLELVATDGRRLALARCPLPKSSAPAPGQAVACIVPTKCLNLVKNLITDRDENIQIAIGDSRIFFAFRSAATPDDAPPSAVLSSTLVEGSFPPYEDVIPKDQDKKVVARRDELQQAVRKAAVLTNEESRGVRMAFTGSDKRLTLSSRAPEMGEAEIKVDLADYTGEDLEISFNPVFLTDVLKVADDDEVIIELKAHNRPGVLRNAASDFLYVVMPVNLPS